VNIILCRRLRDLILLLAFPALPCRALDWCRPFRDSVLLLVYPALPCWPHRLFRPCGTGPVAQLHAGSPAAVSLALQYSSALAQR